MVYTGILALALLAQARPIEKTHSGSFSSPRAILASIDVDHPALVIRGDNLTVDFGNRSLRGTPETVDPDKREGTAVQVIGNNVTIKRARISGYKVAILARDCKGLKVLDSDLSYNWKQHLHSTPEKEDESDWMSYHQNEKDEWLHTYAGALYLRGCSDFEIRNVKVTGGQCGLMMTQCDHGLVWNNDFSFLSGIGIGMYRSSDNRIMHNKVDWCVRGHSEGVYNRGQDSAGILVYEQSNRNVFAYNSATHGGDGFFLWAGQTTMDTGQGGCNDNLVYGNDFSSAPANGIEATFSRNAFVNNKLVECWHGIWGGYSYDTKIWGNAFAMNGEAISIEHGQNNSIVGNTFWRDTDAIGLWAEPIGDPNWGYGKHRDTKSRDYDIRDNFFGNIPGTVFRVRQTSGLSITGNRLERFGHLVADSTVAQALAGTPKGLEGNHLWSTDEGAKRLFGAKNEVDVSADFMPLPPVMKPSGLLLSTANAELDPADDQNYAKRFDVTWSPYPTGESRRKDIEALAPQPLKGAQDAFLSQDAVRGRRYIIVDEWGPYDFKRPIIVPHEVFTDGITRKDSGMVRMSLEVLGPTGHWRVVSINGQTPGADGMGLKRYLWDSLSQNLTGSVPGRLAIMLPDRLPVPTMINNEVVLEYVGRETVDYRGVVTPAGRPIRVTYTKFVSPIEWTVKFFHWTESENPADPHAAPKDIAKVFASTPILQRKEAELSYAGTPYSPRVPNNHYATLAEGSFTVPPGDYVLELTTDDGARLILDGKEIIADAWHYQGPTTYTRELRLDGSQHRIRVEHFQIDGYAALKVNFKPKR